MTITRIERKGMVNVLIVKTFIKSLKIPFSLKLVFFVFFETAIQELMASL